MNTIVSHTIVKNGQPYIGLVLRQVLPFMDRCLVTISEKSTDGTLDVLRQLDKEFPQKMRIDFENVKSPGELTKIRQRQLDMSHEDWILFLDSDDLWSNRSLTEMKKLLDKNEDVDGYGCNPFQVIDTNYYDASWGNRWFTKLFKNQPGVHYEHPWPRDLIYKNDQVLYWKKNTRVPKCDLRFFHLANLMDWRFRDEAWAAEYKTTIGTKFPYVPEWKKELSELLTRI